MDRCWCGYEAAGSTVAGRLARWNAAADAVNRAVYGANEAQAREEQEAWDAMADHDDPEYVKRVEAT